MNVLTPRQEILQTVNRWSLAFRRHNQGRTRRPLPEARLYGSRHINEAVCIARRRRLVSDELLIAAGFNPISRRLPPGRRDADEVPAASSAPSIP